MNRHPVGPDTVVVIGGGYVGLPLAGSRICLCKQLY